jgi:hypothetical protein
MSFNQLPQHYTLDYKQNFSHRIQREPAKLKMAVEMEAIDGYRKRFSQLEKQEMTKITVRHGTTKRQDATSYFRWLDTEKFEVANILDEWDEKELGELISPKGRLTENHGYAYNRTCDDVIIKAAEGLTATGAQGTILTPLPASQIVDTTFTPTGPGPKSGLTFDKVARIRRIFNDNDLDVGRDVYAVISPKADEDLVRDVNEARNKDFSNITPIADGTVDGKRWMGMNWIVHTGLTTFNDGVDDVTNCLFWHKSQMIFGDGEVRSDVDRLPENSHGTQIRTRTRMGAMRVEEKGVVIGRVLA